MTDLRRLSGEVQYCKSTEIQTKSRRTVHFHALIRTDAVVAVSQIHELAIRHGFGHSVDWKLLTGSRGAKLAAWYCAKYASKAADERFEVEWLDVDTGEIVTGAPRLRVWSASRQWGATMAGIKRAQAIWARAKAAASEAPASPPAASAGAEGVGPLDHSTESYAVLQSGDDDEARL